MIEYSWVAESDPGQGNASETRVWLRALPGTKEKIGMSTGNGSEIQIDRKMATMIGQNLLDWGKGTDFNEVVAGR